MSRRTRSQVMVVILIVLIAVARLALQSDPLYQLVQRATLPIAEMVYPAAVQDAPSSEIDNSKALLAESAAADVRRQLDLPELPYEFTNADVIKRDIGGIRKTIWINKGLEADIKANQAVVSSGFLIGKVVDVSSGFSEVQLITDPAFRVSASVGGNMGIVLTKAGSMVYELVPEEGLEGRTVASDGVDGVFPPNLPIGVLDSNIGNGTSVFNTYELKLGQNPAQITYVSVVEAE